jgi:hypothetical protein
MIHRNAQTAAELLFNELIALAVSHNRKRGADEKRRYHKNKDATAQSLNDPLSSAGGLRVTQCTILRES